MYIRVVSLGPSYQKKGFSFTRMCSLSQVVIIVSLSRSYQE